VHPHARRRPHLELASVVAAVSIPEDDPVPVPKCPWHNTTDCVEHADDHEHDRTGLGWRCTEGSGRLFSGSPAEWNRIRPKVLADQAEAMTTSPRPPYTENEGEQR
jgi:hypothetical protein